MIQGVKLDGIHYDLKACLYALASRVSLTAWREEIYGETEFTAAGCPEEYKKISGIVNTAVGMVINGSEKQNVLDFIMKEMFPKINMRELIAAIKENKLSYASYETGLLLIAVESTVPEFIDTYIHLAKKNKKLASQTSKLQPEVL